ncbi:hypothetical protein EYF80_029073 [Liparis tanakae]|uniref:Uncharacterized protein n=1 Tax=Liparis tanakae TaxID=230148 RepID=A0A4Z2H4P2_9TELE|nr:hypothetical protein EYF80_029073 [Liparis tanakae]
MGTVVTADLVMARLLPPTQATPPTAAPTTPLVTLKRPPVTRHIMLGAATTWSFPEIVSEISSPLGALATLTLCGLGVDGLGLGLVRGHAGAGLRLHDHAVHVLGNTGKKSRVYSERTHITLQHTRNAGNREV